MYETFVSRYQHATFVKAVAITEAGRQEWPGVGPA
jgi:hypothetical protein